MKCTVSSQFQNVKLPKMDENWRTAEVVITENEKLLQRYSTWVADRIDEQTLQPDLSQDIRHMYSYDAMHQKAKKKYKGYFHMQFFEGKTAKVESLEALDQLLQSLLAEGIDLKRVTLLTRFAYEAAELAQFLIQRNYSVQSAAGLRVGSHPAVKTIIHILKEDFYTKHSIAQSAVQQFYGEINEEQIQQISQAKSLPLYERIQTIIDILHLQSTEGAVPYLTAFLDIVYQFTKSRIADANAEGVGEIQVRGEHVMAGYYKNEEATKAAFTEDGWMRTGDLGLLDEKGNIFIKGRSKNMILSANGQNIYPEEIEAAVNNQPYVIESVVVDRGARLVALIYMDSEKAKAEGVDLEEYKKTLMAEVNNSMPSYSKVNLVEYMDQPFEKTPKMSIKRFMYR